jgi:CubicO group peptidase (beta-lactamase class C family)
LPAFASNGKEAITVEHLLTHTAGLAAFYPFHAMRLRTRQAIVQFICDDEPRHPLGSTKYSDLSMIILGEIVERLSGRPLDRYVAHAVFRPLGMHSTGACPAHGPHGAARGHPKHESSRWSLCAFSHPSSLLSYITQQRVAQVVNESRHNRTARTRAQTPT